MFYFNSVFIWMAFALPMNARKQETGIFPHLKLEAYIQSSKFSHPAFEALKIILLVYTNRSKPSTFKSKKPLKQPAVIGLKTSKLLFRRRGRTVQLK